MRVIHILTTVCIVLLVSACASLRNGSPGITSETTQTPSPAQPPPSTAEPTVGVNPTAAANPTARYDNLPECERGPNRVSGPPPGPPNGQPVCRSTPTLEVQAARITGLTIRPDVSEIKVGDMVDFRAGLQLTPPDAPPPQVPPPRPGTSDDPAWETDDASVAAVTSGGRLTARAPGEVTLSVRFFGMSATRTLRIIP